MANTFGKTWWGEYFLRSLSNIDYENRLPRGASYARSGKVEKIKFDQNHISAKVMGSRPRPYQVDVILPPFFDPELTNFLSDLKRHPAIISKLLNRELDPEVLTIAEKHGLKVFPKQWTDFKMHCNCPDWAVPCKHLASVIYKISAEIDNNPFLAFNLHKVDLLNELSKLGVFIKKETIEIPKIKDLYFDKSNQKTGYDPELAYQKISFAGLDPVYEALSALLTPFPAFYTSSGDFKEKYKANIARIVKQVQRVNTGKITLTEFLWRASGNDENIGTRANNQVTIDENYLVKVFCNNAEFSLIRFLHQLSKIHSSRTSDYQPSTAFLHTLLQAAVQLTANGAIVPQMVQLPDKSFSVRWLPALLSKEVKKLVEKLEMMCPPEMFLWQEKSKRKEINKNAAFNLLSLIITELVRTIDKGSFGDLFLDLFFINKPYLFAGPGEKELPGGIMSWLQKYFISQGEYSPAIFVEEAGDSNFRVNIEMQKYADGILTSIPLSDIIFSDVYDQNRFEILQSLANLSPFISGLDEFINSGGEKELIMDIQTFTPFLMQIVPAIQLLAIQVYLPKELREILKPKSSVKLKSKNDGKTFLGLHDLFDFEWKVALGDTLMSEEEFRKLIKHSEGLIKFRSNYIYVNQEDIEKINKHFLQTKEMSAFEMLRVALSGEYRGAKIEMTKEIRDLITELTNFQEIDLPQNINATLRPYQKRGYSWMYRNARIGFGSVIADDMGLGKTLQVIAALLKFKEEGHLNELKALVVAPTGLLVNWQSEIEKFAPSLKSVIYHGTGRQMAKPAEYDVMITSYGVARGDADLLKKQKWMTMVIDEAQNIKNHNTQQTKAIKSIKSNNFIAMSGTPVENRLSELWSIMDYSNRGYLGALKEFNEQYSNKIEQLNDVLAAEKLKKITSPFMMRRLKTDKSIISDLPDKIEINSFATLSKEQASLYETTLEKAMADIEGMTANDQKTMFVRQGLILQMILALKQICNHPTQFLKNKILDPALSGKTDLLFDKLDSIVESNEKVLIFTQFREMGDLLKHFIAERYGDEPMFYHGGCSLTQRTDMVNRFQHNHADKIFLLSLKAAGTGLNLTAANHVIHYDLWWNPAVEAQATDRAYRIGQRNNVMVHRFITKNTFEERIDAMIQSKKQLADLTVATGENWIGQLSNKELRELFG